MLLASVAFAAVAPGMAQAAAASDAAAASPAATPAVASVGEVIVTATRREGSVNKIPLSVTAMTSSSLAKHEVQNIDDIRRQAPGIGLSYGTNSDRASTSGDTNISIRGIASITGAATTGVYYDDIPIYKSEPIGSGYGAPYPKVFDLDRVEVLRGPQGTLFGGSTEGGAVRFITPTPSLTTRSDMVKVDTSTTEGGGPSYEFGAETGGPLIKDVLGFRLTAWDRHDGGYIDHVSRFTGATVASDTNTENADMGRLSVLWAPTDKLKVTGAYFRQDDIHDDSDQYWENVPAFNAPAVGFNATGNGICRLVPVTLCASSIPAHTYGPYNMFGPGKTGTDTIDPVTGRETAALQPRKERNDIASLTIDYDFGAADLKSITGIFDDKVHGIYNDTFTGGVPVALAGAATYPADEVFSFPGYWVYTAYNTKFTRLTQELRLTSKNDSRLTWITGAYFALGNLSYTQVNYDDSQLLIPAVRGGETYQQFYGFPIYGSVIGSNPYQKDYGNLHDEELSIAAFAEANYAITDQLKATVGLRASRDQITVRDEGLGAQNRGNTTATIANGGLTNGTVTNSPITPKFSLSYQINSGSMVYGTVGKGFRDGGFNPLNQAIIASATGQCPLSQLDGIPTTYNSDSVWSGEFGAKVGLGGIAQVNASVYRIDWDHIQTTVQTPSCGQYIANAGRAVSQGFDLQAEVRPFSSLTLNMAGGYDDAHYEETIAGSAVGGSAVVVNAGDPIRGVPRWTYNLSATYNFDLLGSRAYLTGDYQFIGSTVRSSGPGTLGYRQDVYRAEPLRFANLRAGANVDDIDVSLYVKNLTNAQDPTNEVGGNAGNRPFAPLIFAQTFRPREVGFSLLKKF